MHIAVGCDHRGLEMKNYVIELLKKAEHVYEDFGCYTSDSVDYPDIAKQVAESVVNGDYQIGILVCDTGIGMSIASNKVKGIRAALCRDAFTAGRARQHNDANILCLAARYGIKGISSIVESFLTNEFEGERHRRRVDKIMAMED